MQRTSGVGVTGGGLGPQGRFVHGLRTGDMVPSEFSPSPKFRTQPEFPPIGVKSCPDRKLHLRSSPFQASYQVSHSFPPFLPLFPFALFFAAFRQHLSSGHPQAKGPTHRAIAHFVRAEYALLLAEEQCTRPHCKRLPLLASSTGTRKDSPPRENAPAV